MKKSPKLKENTANGARTKSQIDISQVAGEIEPFKKVLTHLGSELRGASAKKQKSAERRKELNTSKVVKKDASSRSLGSAKRGSSKSGSQKL